MASVRRVYWDSGIFISYLSDTHPQEKLRADIVQDVLNHAKDGKLEIWTSVWTIVEVLRPKSPIPTSFPLPEWAGLLDTKDENGKILYPKATAHFTQIWEYFNRHTLPERLIPEDDAKKIRGMFEWPWIKKIDVVPVVAGRASEIMRTHNMKASDSIHVASALYRDCDVLQRWDKDFTRTDSLIKSEEPQRLTEDVPETGKLFLE